MVIVVMIMINHIGDCGYGDDGDGGDDNDQLWSC